MTLAPLLVLLLLVGLVSGLTALLVRQSAGGEETTVAEARQYAARTSAAAVAVGLCAAVAAGFAAMLPVVYGVAMAGRAGVAAMMLPLAFGVAHTGTVLVGELTWPRPGGVVRRARLAHRGLLHSVPAWLRRSAAATLAAGVALIAVGAAVADPYGRSVTVRAGGGLVEGAASPFVGSGYGVPALVGLACLVALTLAALWVVANRPAVVTDHEEVEAALRRASAQRVLRGSTTAAMVVVGGLSAVSGLAVRSASTGAAETARLNELPVGVAASVLPWVGGALAVVGMGSALAGVAVFLVRTPAVPAEPVAAGQ
ncbi:hypothetical protein SAMN05661080_00541 [Modestobacter sp. DSM 44400]|uniref:hypothetical protein n=1 Tax=Modestobacter sp. DSM 44400 TaxID=1550230 RepID=UPI0008991771|nr:hypothetical protein [Modestobacter sp. DSM 44400]SDX60385.1 hypothetical protein SAMN05661080_00541 [Modestobacter sp. DSM 44400]